MVMPMEERRHGEHTSFGLVLGGFWLALAILIWAIAVPPPRAAAAGSFSRASRLERLLQAEDDSTPEGRLILRQGRVMAANGVVVTGACWDYANAVYVRAGFGETRRQVVFKCGKRGLFAEPRLIQGGDWLYLVNDSPPAYEHSAIFVRWIDQARKRALLLTYAGRDRRTPGEYEAYTLSTVYTIIRPCSS